MAIVLKERLDQAIDLALMAMENLGNPHGIRIVRAALKSNDRRHVARSLEALDNFEEKELSGQIRYLLENIGGGKPVAQEHHSCSSLITVSEVLHWCRENPDAWIRKCAGHTITTLPATTR